MGTRADFYIGRGLEAQWIGSIAWDGYPNGITPTSNKKDKLGCPESEEWPKGQHLFESKTEEEFRARVLQFFINREDVTLPEQGWPWPWVDSCTTDYAYAFDGGKVYAACFGHKWFDPCKKEPEYSDRQKTCVFPNMKAIQKVTYGNRSGVVILGVKKA